MVVQIEARRPRLAVVRRRLAVLMHPIAIDWRERHANERGPLREPLVREEAQAAVRRSLTLAVLGHASVLIRPELLPHREIRVERVEALALPALAIGPVLEHDAL